MKAQTILVKKEQEVEGIPMCAANFTSPVIDQARFYEELTYTIGNRKYIQNAPHF